MARVGGAAAGDASTWVWASVPWDQAAASAGRWGKTTVLHELSGRLGCWVGFAPWAVAAALAQEERIMGYYAMEKKNEDQACCHFKNILSII